MDDLTIKRESCSVQPIDALPQLQSASLVNCNFENNFCNWKLDTQVSQANWTLSKTTPVLSSSELPTTGALTSSYFLYLRATLPTGMKVFYFTLF